MDKFEAAVVQSMLDKAVLKGELLPATGEDGEPIYLPRGGVWLKWAEALGGPVWITPGGPTSETES